MVFLELTITSSWWGSSSDGSTFGYLGFGGCSALCLADGLPGKIASKMFFFLWCINFSRTRVTETLRSIWQGKRARSSTTLCKNVCSFAPNARQDKASQSIFCFSQFGPLQENAGNAENTDVLSFLGSEAVSARNAETLEIADGKTAENPEYSRSNSQNSKSDSRNAKFYSRNGISRPEQYENQNSRSNSWSESPDGWKPTRKIFICPCVLELFLEAQKATPNPEIPPKQRVYTNFFEKFDRTLLCFPVA